MGKKNFLEDLYVLGKEVTFEGTDQTAWLQKLNSTEEERAIRSANAARARIMIDKRNPESDPSVTLRNQTFDFDIEAAVEFLLQPQVTEATQKIEARLEGEDEWAADGYLQGLRDAWTEGLRDEWTKGQLEENPERRAEAYVEADKVYAELSRFRELVDKELAHDVRGLRETLELSEPDEIRDKLFDRLFESMSDVEWMDAYQKAQLAIAVRDGKTREPLFGDLGDVERLQDSTLLQLLSEYRSISVDPAEGKDSQETPSS